MGLGLGVGIVKHRRNGGGAPPSGGATIFRGQHDPASAEFAGPLGGETTFLSPRGAVLHPTGSGRWVYVNNAATGANNGTSLANAYTTIQAAIDDHIAGDCILVEPGVYVETTYSGVLRGPAPNAFGVTKANQATATDRVKITRRGSGKVEITATDPLGGWVECVNGDADNNPNWANMWKTTFTPSTIPAMVSRVLVQDGTLAFLRVSGAGYTSTDQMFSQNDTNKWWNNANSGMTGSKAGSVLTLTSASVFGAYAAGTLDDAVAVMHYTPGNNTVQGEILSHTPGSNQITATFTQTTYGNGVILLNVAKDINAAGQWAYKDNGGGSFTVFFWPYDEAKMDKIRITARENVFEADSAANWTFYGLDFTGSGGTGIRKGTPVRSTQNANLDRAGLHFEECRMAQFVGDFCIGIDMERAPGLNLLNSTVEFAINGKGISIIRSPGAWTDKCLVASVGNTGVNLSSANEQVFSYSEIRDVRSTHGNGMSIYQGADKVVVWGNKIATAGGIGVTHQESANLYIGMNLVVAPEGDSAGNRGIENNGTFPPNKSTVVFSGPVTILNNSVAPWPTATGSETPSGIITNKTSNATHNACNNVSFGGVDPTLYGTRVPTQNVTYNSVTYNAVVGRYEDNVVNHPGTPGGTFFGTNNNTLNTSPANVFVSYPTGNYAPKAGGPADVAGGNHSDLLPSGTWIDWFDFNRDLEGRAFNWAVNPPMGALLPVAVGTTWDGSATWDGGTFWV